MMCAVRCSDDVCCVQGAMHLGLCEGHVFVKVLTVTFHCKLWWSVIVVG